MGVFYTITPCLKDTRRRMNPHTNRWTTQKVSNDEQKSPLSKHSCFPCFPPSFCLSQLILTSHLWAARTDRLHNQHVSLPVGTFWRTSWKADGSPVLSGQSPDGKHADLQKAVHAVSQLQQARRASCCLILTPDSGRNTFIPYFFLHGIPILLPLCSFLPLGPFLQPILYNNLVFFPIFKAV